MPTSYPGAIDSFTDPTANSPESDHAAQHDNANDAITAIETYVGTNAGGTILKTAGNLSGLTSADTARTNLGAAPFGVSGMAGVLLYDGFRRSNRSLVGDRSPAGVTYWVNNYRSDINTPVCAAWIESGVMVLDPTAPGPPNANATFLIADFGDREVWGLAADVVFPVPTGGTSTGTQRAILNLCDAAMFRLDEGCSTAGTSNGITTVNDPNIGLVDIDREVVVHGVTGYVSATGLIPNVSFQMVSSSGGSVNVTAWSGTVTVSERDLANGSVQLFISPLAYGLFYNGGQGAQTYTIPSTNFPSRLLEDGATKYRMEMWIDKATSTVTVYVPQVGMLTSTDTNFARFCGNMTGFQLIQTVGNYGRVSFDSITAFGPDKQPPARVSFPYSSVLSCPGGVNDYLYTPGPAGLVSGGVFEWRAYVVPNSWAASARQAIGPCQWNNAHPLVIWFGLDSTAHPKNICIGVSADGTTTELATMGPHTYTSGGWIHGTFDTGSGIATAYTSPDGVIYTQIGTQTLSAGLKSPPLWSPPPLMLIGGRDATEVDIPFAGQIVVAQLFAPCGSGGPGIKNHAGVAGPITGNPLVAGIDRRVPSAGVDPAGNEWRLSGAASWLVASSSVSGLVDQSLPSIGQQVAYAKITANPPSATTLVADTWTAVTGAPSIALPNDGNTYKVLIYIPFCQLSVAGVCRLGLYDTTHSALIVSKGVDFTATSIGFGGDTVEAQQVVGAGQTITLYAYSASTPTLSIFADTGSFQGPCEIAAYRVA